MRMVNCLGIDGARNVALDSLYGLEDQVGGQIRELLDTAVTDDSGIVVPAVSEEADFDYGEMPTKAGVGLVFAPDVFKTPFKFRFVPSVGNTETNESFGKLIFGHG